MANRSYIYFKNGDETRVLAEGIYSIPYFWQLFWNEEDLQAAIDLWKKVEELEKEDKEKAEEYMKLSLDALGTYAEEEYLKKQFDEIKEMINVLSKPS